MWRPHAQQQNEHLDVEAYQPITSGAPAAVETGVRLLTKAAIEKPPFAGPQAVLAYLSRYTHRVAISNSRILGFDETGVTFRYKDYRRAGADRQQVMTLAADEFIRRFLLHILPQGFHRIRHYGLLAGATRKSHLERARELLGVAPPADGRSAGRTRRLPAAMPVLRRTHGRRRNLRTLATASRAARRRRPDREQRSP